MRPSEALQNHITAIRSAIHQHHTTNPRVFGSVLDGKDRDRSDPDLLVAPLPETILFDLGGLQIELKALQGVPVEVRTPGELPVQIRARILAAGGPCEVQAGIGALPPRRWAHSISHDKTVMPGDATEHFAGDI